MTIQKQVINKAKPTPKKVVEQKESSESTEVKTAEILVHSSEEEVKEVKKKTNTAKQPI